MSKLSDVFDIEKKIDDSLKERVAAVITQVVMSIDKASPALGDLLAGEPVELQMNITLQLKQKK